MDVQGGILTSEMLSITQHRTLHTRILTRFAYGISCLRVTKLRLNAKCAHSVRQAFRPYSQFGTSPLTLLKTGKQEIV